MNRNQQVDISVPAINSPVASLLNILRELQLWSRNY